MVDETLYLALSSRLTTIIVVPLGRRDARPLTFPLQLAVHCGRRKSKDRRREGAATKRSRCHSRQLELQLQPVKERIASSLRFSQ